MQRAACHAGRGSIATEACRAADNSAEFLDRVREATGFTLEIVDRETEAFLATAGCCQPRRPEAEGVVLFDIGGGSSEIVWLAARISRIGGDRVIAARTAALRGARPRLGFDEDRRRQSRGSGSAAQIVTPEIFEAMVADVAATRSRRFAAQGRRRSRAAQHASTFSERPAR